MNLPQHYNFANLPTPIIPVKRFFSDLDSYHVHLKRDDFTGVELSGNKVRKLNFLFKEAIQQGAKHVITCGGLQSNHCRATAFFATKLGLKTTLVLRGTAPEAATGNLLLGQLLKANIVLISEEEYKNVDALMAKIVSDFDEPGYIIPEGGSNEIGAWGYVDAFYEIMKQDNTFDTIVVPSGSGGTHAGLLLAKMINKSTINIASVNVCDDADYFKQKINTIMHRFCERYNQKLNWEKDDIHILDGFVGKGYAQIGEDESSLIQRFAQTEGIIMDPVYGAKAMLGLESNLKLGSIPGKKILYIHTGGIFGLFPFSEMFR